MSLQLYLRVNYDGQEQWRDIYLDDQENLGKLHLRLPDETWTTYTRALNATPLWVRTWGGEWELAGRFFASNRGNNANGGIAGAIVSPANSGGVSGDPWTQTTGGVRYATEQTYEGPLAYEFDDSDEGLVWQTTDASGGFWPPEIYLRTYVYLTTDIPSGKRHFIMGPVIGLINPEANNTTGYSNICLDHNRFLAIQGTELLDVVLGTVAAPLGSWFRLEAHFSNLQRITSNNSILWQGSVQLRLFSDPNSTISDDEIISMDTVLSETIDIHPAAGWAGALFGSMAGGASGALEIFYLDKLAMSSTGWIGP